MTEMSKLQIRAKVLSVISEIKSLQYRNEEAFQKYLKELDEISDKKAVLDIFLKEYIKLEEDDYTFCACLLKELIPLKDITDKAMDYLKSSAYSDECKYKIVQMLRISGGNYNYSELPEYFDNPDEIMDLETKRLLDSAVFNPESMLDFLDFVSAVSENDRNLLLKSLSLDYNGDELANIVYPVLYSDFSDEFILQAIDILLDSKSSLAIAPFEYLIKVSSNEKIVSACNLGLKKLKLAGASKEKANEYFKNILRNSKPAQCFVTIPDGSGKQALLTTRKQNDNYSLAAFVISDLSGITDCFGFFNISKNEVLKVINKFCNSEGHYIVPNEYVKSQIIASQQLNIDNKLYFPYEFICWKPVIEDVEPMNISLKTYAEENCNIQPVSNEEAISLLVEEYTLRWFLTPSDNDIIRDITENIYNQQSIDIKEINKMLKDNINNIFNAEITDIWINRFYNLIYILSNNDRKQEADIFYSILKNEELFELFKQIIVQRSVFNYFVALKENTKNSFFTTNIFRKRNSNENKYDIKQLNNIIDILKRGWLER